LDEFVKDIEKELKVLKIRKYPKFLFHFKDLSFEASFQQNQKDTLLPLSFDFEIESER
jgi:hypothetical protein